MDSSIRIEERAAEWLAKRDSGDWTPADEAEFTAWLEACTAHEVAFIRLEGAWNTARRLKAVAPGHEVSALPPPPGQWGQLSPFFESPESDAPPPQTLLHASAKGEVSWRSTKWRVRIAASIVLLLAAALGAYLLPVGPQYQTPVGGLAHVPMPDGSRVTLNTDSAINVDVTEKERRVELEQGEAFFEVAKDPTRPFVVIAGKKRIVAVGTQFSVRRTGDDVRVFVTEGKVRLEGEGPNIPELGATLVSAGSIARTVDDTVLLQQNALPKVQEYLAWRSGFLIFDEVSLSEAVAEFNRYNQRQIVISDPQVAEIRLSGKFRSTSFEAFVRLLEEGFPVHAESEGDEIILTQR